MFVNLSPSLLTIIVLAGPTLSQQDWLKRSDLVFRGEVLKLFMPPQLTCQTVRTSAW